MIPQVWMLILLISVGGVMNPRPPSPMVIPSNSTDGRVCCDLLCSEPISYGRTQQRHITKDMGFLSYPASAIVTVLAKGAYFGESGDEFWEAEIQGKRGLIRSTAINEMTYKCQPQDFFAKKEGKVEDGLPGAGTSDETDHQSNSDRLLPTTKQDLVSNQRPVEDQLDSTQLPTQGQGDQSDKPADNSERKMEGEEGMRSDYQKQQEQPPRDGEVDHLGTPKTDPNLASISEHQPPSDTHQGEKSVDADKQGHHDGESRIHMASQTFERFDTDQNQRASNEHMNTHTHKLFETPPPTATPPPDAVLPDEMLALLNTPHATPNNGRVVGDDDHVTYASGRSDQPPPVMQGNLPRDGNEAGSGDFPQQTIPASDAQSHESDSLEGRNVDSGERVDRVDTYNDDDDDDDDDWNGDWGEKPDSKRADGQVDVDARFDQSEGDKPPQAGDSESEITTSNASTDQPNSDPGRSTSDLDTFDHSDSNGEQSEEKKTTDFYDDDYYEDHYWDDVPEPEYTGNVDLGQTDEPVLLFEPLEEEEQQQERPPVQEVSEERDDGEGETEREEYRSAVDDGDGNREDSEGQTQSVDESPSSDHTQSDDAHQSETDTASSRSMAEASLSEAPPTVAPSSEIPQPPDTHHSDFESLSSEAQPSTTDDKTPPSEAPPTEDEVPSQTQPSGFESNIPPSKAGTDTRRFEAPPSGTETPPPSQSDSSDRQQVETGSRLDLSQNNNIDLLQPSHLHPSPSVTHLPGAGGMDGQQPTINSGSEKDDRVNQVPVYSSSQLPLEGEQIQEPEKEVIVDGTHLPDDDDDDIRTTPFQSPVLTQSVTSTPIPGSDSTDVSNNGDTHYREAPSLDEISARAEQLKARLNSEHHHTADSSADSSTVQGTPTDQERATADGADGGVSSTAADHQPEARREAPQPVEDTPNQIPDQSDPAIEDGATPPPPPYDAYESGEGRASREDTPTRPPVNADLAFEEPPPPPRGSYSCRDDYLPMPGASRGGWMAYHEQIRARVRDFVLDALPKEWSDWVCYNRPMMAVIMTTVICFSLFVPLMMIWCLSGRSGKQKLKEVQIKLANYRKLEEDHSKAQNDKSVLERRLRESEDRCQELQDKNALQKQDFDGLAREKGEIEAHYRSVTGALTTAQQEISQYLANTEQLNAQITHLQSQVAAVVSEREGALEQATQLTSSMQELEQKLQGLEAQKDQLEEDRFTAQTALQELQSQHEQVTAELEETKEQCDGLRNDLSSVSANLEAKLATLTEKEEELQILRSCLSQVTEQAAAATSTSAADNDIIDGGASPSPAEGGEAVDGEQEGEAVGGEKKRAQLEKIQAMLNTTKVQLELRETTEERDRLLTELREKTAKLEEQIAENEQLSASYSALETKEQETSFQLKELELKMKGVKEYFQEKERELHKRIEVGEVSRMRYEQLESEAQEKATMADQERQRERQELTELRDQITEIEKSYSNQIKNTELRAGDAIASLRRTEQELRQANREITLLRRRLSEFENAPPPSSIMRPIPARGRGYTPLPGSRTRPPSTGPPPPHEGSLQPPRPISAPRLDPRTSSPSGSESLGPLPSLPAVPRVTPGGGGVFHKSQSSSAMLNTSLPPLGTPGTAVERPGSRGASSEVSLSAHPSSSSSVSLTSLSSSASQPTGEQRAGERLPPSRQAPPPQTRPASMGHPPPWRTSPVPTAGPVAPPPPSSAAVPPSRPIPPSHPGRVPPYGYRPPQPYAGGAPPPPPPGGRMYRGPPPSTSGRPPYPPGGPYPPPPRQPMAPPSSGGTYRPPPPPQGGRIRTPGPPPPGSYPTAAAAGERPPVPSQPHNSSWQQPPPPSSRGHPAPTHGAWSHGYHRYYHSPSPRMCYQVPHSRPTPPPYHAYHHYPYHYHACDCYMYQHCPVRDTPPQRPVSSAVPVAHLTNNDSCSDSDKDRPMTTRPAPTDGLTTVESDAKARSCDTGTCSQGDTQTERAQWRESKSENLSVVREPEDRPISSDSDSGIGSALSSPTEITNQSLSDFSELIPAESVAPDLEANIHSPSPPLSLTEASQIASEASRPLPVDNSIAAQPVCSHSACEEDEASATEFGIVAVPPPPSLVTQVPHYGEECGSNLSAESIDSTSPLVEASYACYERDTSSPKPTKSVHFATPLVTEVIFFPTGASEESKPQTANAAPPTATKTVSYCAPLMAEATHSACEQNNVFLTSFETDNTAVYSTPRPPPSSLATLFANVSHHGESTPEASDASLAFIDPESGLPPPMEAMSSYPPLSSPVHPPPPSNLATLPTNISHYGESTPEPSDASLAFVDPESGLMEAMSSYPPLPSPVHSPPPSNPATLPMNISQHGESNAEAGDASLAFIDPESGLPPLKEAASRYPPLPSPVHPPPPSNLATLHYGESTPEVSDSSLAFADSESALPPLMEAVSSHPLPLPSTANAGCEESNRWIPGAVVAGAIDFIPLLSSCASQWEAENGTNTEVASAGSVDCLPSLLGDDREEHGWHVKENTFSPGTAATVQGAPSEPHVAQAAQQVSSCSYNNNNDIDFDDRDSDEDDEVEEEQRIATLFMNFCYCDENKEKREKSTSRKKKAPLVAVDEGFTAPAENKAPTDIATSFASPPSLPLTDTTYMYPECPPEQQNSFNYTTAQALPPPSTQTAYVASTASTGVAVNMESIYTDSQLPTTDKTCTTYPACSPEQQNNFNYTTAQVLPPPPSQAAYVASTASTGVAVNMESIYTDSQLPMTDKVCTAYPPEQQNGFNYTTAQVSSPPPPTQTAYVASAASTGVAVNMESTYTDSKLLTTDKTATCTAREDKPPVLFVPDDGDLHVHDYARRREERSSYPLCHAAKAGQPSLSTFSFTAFTGEGTGNVPKETTNYYGGAQV